MLTIYVSVESELIAVTLRLNQFFDVWRFRKRKPDTDSVTSRVVQNL